MARTPQRFVQRAGGRMPGRIRRALDGTLDSTQRFGDTLEIGRDGRLEIKLAKDETALEMTRQGLRLKESARGEMNRPKLDHMTDLSSSAALADVISKVNDLFSELRRTGNMKGRQF